MCAQGRNMLAWATEQLRGVASVPGVEQTRGEYGEMRGGLVRACGAVN